MKPENVLLVPGWHGSGLGHWQTYWERRHGYRRVEQHDWDRPLRGDWLAHLEDVVLSCDESVLLVAHSLGCMLVAAWAAHTQHAARVKGALLVAPADVERAELTPALRSWRPVEMQRLPFASVMVASRDDPHCSFERARLFAHAWDSQFIDMGACGHINADSHLASWPEGHVLLMDLMKD